MLKQYEAWRRVPELAREIGVSDATIYTWKSKYGGMEVGEAQRLKGLEDENRCLKSGGRPQPGRRSTEGDRSKKTGGVCRHEEGCGVRRLRWLNAGSARS